MTEKHLTTVENIIAFNERRNRKYFSFKTTKTLYFYLHIMELHMDNYLKVKNIKLHKMKV